MKRTTILRSIVHHRGKALFFLSSIHVSIGGKTKTKDSSAIYQSTVCLQEQNFSQVFVSLFMWCICESYLLKRQFKRQQAKEVLLLRYVS